jgi:septum formation protein
MNFNRPIILASSSPRRQFLMKEAGFHFTVESPDIDESYPAQMPVQDVPRYLAEKKARVFESEITDEVVVTSDTVVILGTRILNKPADRPDAMDMLTQLSGRNHTVITAVCLLAKNKFDCFDDRTEVTFRKLTHTEIENYIDNYRPFDKAGAYGAQDCLPEGFNPCSDEEIDFLRQIGKTDLIDKSVNGAQPGIRISIIESISGSYFNVMGLPLHKVYKHLKDF